MKIAFFDTHEFEKDFFAEKVKKYQNMQIYFLNVRLTEQTVLMASGCDAVCAFVNDQLNANVLAELKKLNVQLVALRSAGFNNVDLEAAKKNNIRVTRVPEYSPYAVAEHAVALIQTLNRKTHKAYNRVREGNFSLEGLVGFDLHKKTVGLIGTGRIGSAMAKIMLGFGCQVLAHDIQPKEELKAAGVCYVQLEDLLKASDIISLHVPLNPKTKHLLNEESLKLVKPDVMIINTSRGALIDTPALIRALKKKKIGSAGLDVYEEEEGVFFHDFSGQGISDDVLARLLTFPNVMLTSHQGFLTQEALNNIAETTLENIQNFSEGRSQNIVV